MEKKQDQAFQGKLMVGCAGVILLLVALIGSGLIYFAAQQRQAVRFPGSVLVSSHANYAGLPTHLRWDDSFRMNDSFTRVYNWYSTKFNLGSESRANGECILLEGSNQYIVIEQYMSVFLCQTDNGQVVYVSRFTSVR